MSRLIQKEWMNETNRTSRSYLDGVEYFCAFAHEKDQMSITCPCPCNNCRNGKRYTFDTVGRHLVLNGMDSTYRVWYLHGEKPVKHSTKNIAVEVVIENAGGEDTMDVGEENAMDIGHEMENLVDVSFGVHNVLSDINADNEQAPQFEEQYTPEPNCEKRYNDYKRKAEEKLYPSCEGPETTLSAIVELHNLKKKFGWSGTSVTALLAVLKRWLPKGNTLPEKYPVMKQMIKDLGMKAKCIDACVNDCILYWKHNANATECPKCKAPRYKVNKGKRETNVAQKILRHFPIIPRLKRLYTIPWIACDMTWHDRAEPSWDYIRHPIDSSQWRKCKERWPDFAKEGRNVWLAIATDGFNPYGVQSNSYSCWPVFVVPYNLPPSLCMKAEFQMMALLIPGPKAPSQDICVFLEPLVDELQQLWEEGVSTYDMFKKEQFMLRAILMWGIHDFPAYGNLSGCVTHGYKACPICADNTHSVRLTNSCKIVYTNFLMFLKMDHPYRSGKYLGLGIEEYRAPPKRLERDELLQKLSCINYVPGKSKKPSNKRRKVQATDNDADENEGNGDDVTEAWYKKSILFELEYWSHHKVRHVIDVMHTEKNVAEHIINTILDKKKGTKDTPSGREDMKLLGVHSSQWIRTDKETGEELMPIGTFELTSKEKKHFCQILKDLKLPTGFSSNLSNNVTLQPPRLHGLKSHDYHVIMCYLLPVLLQHAFPRHPDLRRAMHQISLFFNLLCSKVLIRQEIQDAKFMVAEALCVLEKHFPLSFFDISIHLLVHLADEALICGPTRDRWMYPFERSMKDCKNIPNNKRYVEGSIAESYLVSESVKYAMEYMPNPRDGNHKSSQEAFFDENSEYCDEGPLSDFKPLLLSKEQFIQIRRWIMFRLDVEGVSDLYSKYLEDLQKETTSGKGRRKLTEVELKSNFIVDLYNKLLKAGETKSELWRLAKGPRFEAKSYKKYRFNGFTFATKSHDDTVATQDSGVCMQALTTYVSSSKDKNPIDAWTTWYGVIKEIIEVDYTIFQQVVFYCDWVRAENGCKLCPDSKLRMVNMTKLKSSKNFNDEPVILACEASQVFYSKDLENPDWWVVIHSPKRLTTQVDDLKKPTPEAFQSILYDQPQLKELMKNIHEL